MQDRSMDAEKVSSREAPYIHAIVTVRRSGRELLTS
jgi:hypothetical protein